MELLTAILGIICIPIYVLCVVVLLAITPIFGSYVDASVYVCEYGQPAITGILTLCLLVCDCIYIFKAIRRKKRLHATILILISLIYLLVIYISFNALAFRIETYAGMTNREIFNYVVDKLRLMGNCLDGTVNIRGHQVGFGYIVANFMTYILPISLTSFGWLIQQVVTKKLKNNN